MIDFRTKIGIRFCAPSVGTPCLRVFNRGSIFILKPGIDFDLKIADRFPYQNRIAINPDIFLIAIIGAIAI
jgi:hypothetical protein